MKKIIKNKDLLHSIILTIILWCLFPIRFCFNVYPDFTGETVRVCQWFTFGSNLISEIYYQGWENYFVIIISVELVLLFIISFVIVKIFNKVMNGNILKISLC